MKLATLRDGSRDGQLAVVSKDLTRFLDAGTIAPTLQAALDDWAVVMRERARLIGEFNADYLDAISRGGRGDR